MNDSFTFLIIVTAMLIVTVALLKIGKVRYVYIVPEGYAGLLYHKGKFVEVLGAGRHIRWGRHYTLDPQDLRQLPIAHPARRLLDVRVHFAQRDVAVGDHGRYGQRGQGEDDGPVTQPESQERDDDDPERRDGASNVGDIDRQVAEASVVAEHNAHRQSDRSADGD